MGARVDAAGRVLATIDLGGGVNPTTPVRWHNHWRFACPNDALSGVRIVDVAAAVTSFDVTTPSSLEMSLACSRDQCAVAALNMIGPTQDIAFIALSDDAATGGRGDRVVVRSVRAPTSIGAVIMPVYDTPPTPPPTHQMFVASPHIVVDGAGFLVLWSETDSGSGDATVQTLGVDAHGKIVRPLAPVPGVAPTGPFDVDGRVIGFLAGAHGREPDLAVARF
jgi:hypothetical protein